MKNARPKKLRTSALDKPDSTQNLDLFPENFPVVIPARFPKTGTRADETLRALLNGPQNQADYINGWRLAANVKALEYDGWAIRRRPIIKPGCRREIKEYSLDRSHPSNIAALSARRIESA